MLISFKTKLNKVCPEVMKQSKRQRKKTHYKQTAPMPEPGFEPGICHIAVDGVIVGVENQTQIKRCVGS